MNKSNNLITCQTLGEMLNCDLAYHFEYHDFKHAWPRTSKLKVSLAFTSNIYGLFINCFWSRALGRNLCTDFHVRSHLQMLNASPRKKAGEFELKWLQIAKHTSGKINTFDVRSHIFAAQHFTPISPLFYLAAEGSDPWRPYNNKNHQNTAAIPWKFVLQ